MAPIKKNGSVATDTDAVPPTNWTDEPPDAVPLARPTARPVEDPACDEVVGGVPLTNSNPGVAFATPSSGDPDDLGLFGPMVG